MKPAVHVSTSGLVMHCIMMLLHAVLHGALRLAVLAAMVSGNSEQQRHTSHGAWVVAVRGPRQ